MPHASYTLRNVQVRFILPRHSKISVFYNTRPAAEIQQPASHTGIFAIKTQPLHLRIYLKKACCSKAPLSRCSGCHKVTRAQKPHRRRREAIGIPKANSTGCYEENDNQFPVTSGSMGRRAKSRAAAPARHFLESDAEPKTPARLVSVRRSCLHFYKRRYG